MYLYQSLELKFKSTSFENNISLENLFRTVRYGHGVCGSVFLEDSRITSGWYNMLYIPHRTGGNEGDNMDFGTLLLFPLNFSGQSYIIRQQDGNVMHVRGI